VTDDGYWLREDLVTITNPSPPPPDLAPGEKWIDVNLKNETLVAFEGTTPVYATLISSGKRDLDDKDHDHPTHNGTFRIREKHVAATMDADTASDGPYSIEDVPWIQYFHGSIALHGAFWHAAFGQTKSHGCVNLAPWDARSLFFWTEPQVPAGWNAVWATPEHPGTRVIVHDEAKPNYETDDEEETQP
jgi:lipoprotein-anchoring transpeptidase ErfK/SrfK